MNIYGTKDQVGIAEKPDIEQLKEILPEGMILEEAIDFVNWLFEESED